MTRTRRRLVILVAVLAVLVLVAVLVGYRVWKVYRFDGQTMSIPGSVPSISASEPARPPPSPSDSPFVTGVSRNGHYFVDQRGRPLLVRGDSPWSLLGNLDAGEAEKYWRNRQGHGVNAAILALVGAREDGGRESGSTVDGIKPFLRTHLVGRRSVTRPNPEYLQRAHEVIASAARHGITVFLYPIDGWTIGHAFSPRNVGECATYAREIQHAFADLPNIVWTVGGDYVIRDPPSDVDRCYDALRVGLRNAGDRRPFSIQFTSPLTLSTDSRYWSSRVTWNFVYSYAPTYAGMLRAYARKPAMPAVLGETNYERMNLQPDTPPTTNESLRRQVLWTLTSGGAGEFYGSADWEFLDGWRGRLDSPGLQQVSRLRSIFESIPWWNLVPDTDSLFVTSGRGEPVRADQLGTDVLDNEYVTAALTADHREAVAYVPSSRTITIDRARLAGRPAAVWIDPSTGSRTPVALTPRLTPPGRNADGGHDWLLLVGQEGQQ